MEYVRGEDVFAHLSQHGRFTEEDALRIAKDIAAALEHIHGEHLVHRDIKPENILIGQDGTAKLADLGLAIDDDVPNQARITKAGTAMGTPYYLSPEQIRGEEEADIRSDIYSLGATLYEMVSGKPPFEGESPAVVMMKCLQEQVPSPRDIDRTVSVAFCHMLERMMAKDPAERYQTPAELSADISRVQHGETPLGERPETGRSNLARPSQKGPDDSTARRKTPKSDDKLAKEKSPVKTSSPMAAPSDKMEAITEDAITAEWKTKYMILWAIAAGAVMLAILLIWQLAK
jgi:serine/threonine protein kinase